MLRPNRGTRHPAPHGSQVLRLAWRAIVVAGALALATAGPAEAHPFGDPQTVGISLEQGRDDVVRVRWKVGGLDDLTLLGVSLGLIPNQRVMLDGAVFYQASDGAAIGRSDKFADYLLKQITVVSAGKSCSGVVEPPTDIAKSGVEIAYTCPAKIGAATVSVKTLTDLNPAYRTLATGPNGERAVYAATKDSFDWKFSEAVAAETPSRGESAVLQIAIVVGVLLLIAAIAVVAKRRRAAA